MVSGLVVVLLLQEKVLVGAVSGEQNGSCSQTRQGATESVPTCEGALKSPSIRSLPGVVSGLASGFLEGSQVEAGDVALGASGGGL